MCTYFVAKDPVKMSYGDWPIELTLLHATHLKLLKQGFIVPPRWAGTPKVAIKSINLLALLNWPVRLQTHHSAKPVFWTLKSKAKIDNAWMRLTHLGWSTATYVAWELWVMSLTLWAIVALYFFRSPNSGGMSMQPSRSLEAFSLQIICEYFWNPGIFRDKKFRERRSISWHHVIGFHIRKLTAPFLFLNTYIWRTPPRCLPAPYL